MAMMSTQDALGEVPLAAAKWQIRIAIWPHELAHYCDCQNRCSYANTFRATTGMLGRGKIVRNKPAASQRWSTQQRPALSSLSPLDIKMAKRPARAHPHPGRACHKRAQAIMNTRRWKTSDFARTGARRSTHDRVTPCPRGIIISIIALRTPRKD